MNAETRLYRERHPFFSELPAYVLTFQGKEGKTRIATEKTASGRAILCYLSPVDALIGAGRFSHRLRS